MYLRPETIVHDWTAVEHFITSHPLGLLTTSIPLPGQSTIQASHLPFLYTPPDEPPSSTDQEGSNVAKTSVIGVWNGPDLGVLRCHLARSNPQAKALVHLENQQKEEEVLVLFSDPTNQSGYISPQWYINTKPTTAKVVPTWNYSELQLYGQVTIVSPSQIVRDLSDTHEHRLAQTLKHPKDQVWSIDDAPKTYIELLQRAIIGVEIKVSKVAFKCKMSREKNQGDRKGILEGLRSVGAEGEAKVADSVERLGPLK
ncbi:related to transcriptional regulator [Ustilago trichophora]|uniref:Related to transcriptional regulator n=1 Tax=Ustilago trichophora TaxID=86804 RepID=A0A5C3DRN7_9BASI|nr:related to transcriptional regulator [Ustilago trichophora]